MRNFGMLMLLGITFGVSIVYSRSVRNERSANFLTEDVNEDFVERYSDHLLRLRRAAEHITTPTKSTKSKFRIGSCAFEDFLRSAKNCSAAFYRDVRSENSSTSQCKNIYEELRSCMLSTLTNCIEGSFLDKGDIFAKEVAKIKQNFLVFLGDEKFWCEKGGLGVSSDFLPKGYTCNPVFYHIGEDCTATYRRLFKTNATDKKLCTEYEKAKICYLETIFRHCSFDRTMRHVLEIMIQITDDFQPFCKRTIKQEESTLERLVLSKDCPPYSLADVAFALDVTNGTNRKQYIAMKRMIEGVAKKLDYGSRGAQFALFQFDTQIRSMLKFGRPATKSMFIRYVRRMARTTSRSKNKAKRMTGRALSSLGRTTFSPTKTGELIKKPYKSGQRPHNPAVLFVMTTGRSTDSTNDGFELLKDRNVHVVYVGQVPQQPRKVVGPPIVISGPSPVDSFLGKKNPADISTDFKLRAVNNVVKIMLEEICFADRKEHLQNSAFPEEAVVQTSRLVEYDLLYLFELKPIVSPQSSQLPPLPSESTENPSNWLGPIYEEGYDGGMDGDIFMPRQVPQPSEASRWPFYMNDNEYIIEATLGNPFFSK